MKSLSRDQRLTTSLTQVDTTIYVGMGTDRNNGDTTVDVGVYKDNAGTDGLYMYIKTVGV